MTTDRISGSAFALFALGVIWESRKLPLGTFRQPSPAYMPVLLALLLLIFGILIATTGMRAGAPSLPRMARMASRRVAALPDVPTFKEIGYDIEFYIWAGMFAPKGTPEPVMKKVRHTLRQVVQEAEFKDAMTKLETPIAYLDAPAFQKFWDEDARMLAEATRRIGRIEEAK
jgi:hypothetical protein